MYFFAAYGEPPHSFYTVIWGTPAAIVGLIGAFIVIRKTNMTVVHIISVTGLVIITLFVGLVVILTQMAIKAVENGDKLESLF
jgi:ABC-type phosphate transport system permease subunit